MWLVHSHMLPPAVLTTPCTSTMHRYRYLNYLQLACSAVYLWLVCTLSNLHGLADIGKLPWDVQKGIDLGPLMSPGEGAVTALAFFTPAGKLMPTHLLSGAADGSIAVWASSGGWDCLKVLKGHKCAPCLSGIVHLARLLLGRTLQSLACLSMSLMAKLVCPACAHG